MSVTDIEGGKALKLFFGFWFLFWFPSLICHCVTKAWKLIMCYTERKLVIWNQVVMRNTMAIVIKNFCIKSWAKHADVYIISDIKDDEEKESFEIVFLGIGICNRIVIVIVSICNCFSFPLLLIYCAIKAWTIS